MYIWCEYFQIFSMHLETNVCIHMCMHVHTHTHMQIRRTLQVLYFKPAVVLKFTSWGVHSCVFIFTSRTMQPVRLLDLVLDAWNLNRCWKLLIKPLRKPIRVCCRHRPRIECSSQLSSWQRVRKWRTTSIGCNLMGHGSHIIWSVSHNSYNFGNGSNT